MNYSIVKVDAANYPLFEDMIFWRENGYERAPDLRGKGIGRALMAKADALKDELEATGSRLYVSVDNRSAKALYEKSGFREEGHTLFMEK